MAGLTDFASAEYLNYVTGQLVTPALPSVWVGLFTTAPTSDSGVTGAVEVTGGSYARQQVAGQLAASSASGSVITFGSVPSWVVAGMSVRDVTTPGNVPANTIISSLTSTTVTCNNSVAGVGTDTIRFSVFAPPVASAGSEPPVTPGFSSNTNAIIQFVQSTGDWTTVVAWGLFDAVTTGNCRWWDYLGNFKWIPFTGTLASPSVLTAPGHGYINGDKVVVTAKFGGTLPQAGSFAGVLTVAGVSGDTFNVGVNAASASGEGQVRKITQQP